MELRNPEAAEDCVQEALLAALSAEAGFQGRSNLRTWLTGILKHKIIDAIRRQGRERPLEDPEEGLADLEALFDHTGHWVDRPQPWSVVGELRPGLTGHGPQSSARSTVNNLRPGSGLRGCPGRFAAVRAFGTGKTTGTISTAATKAWAWHTRIVNILRIT